MIINKFFIIIILILLHYIINTLEKINFYLHINDTKITTRPLNDCSNDNNIKQHKVCCFGLPSGHLEILIILLYFLYKHKIISISTMYIFILLMGLQRVMYNMHTRFQVFIGILFGFMYSFIYSYTNYSYKSIIISLIVISLLTINIYFNIEKKLKEQIPEWVDKDMYEKMNEKKNCPLYIKILSILLGVYDLKHTIYISWEQVQNNLDKIIDDIKKTGIKYDCVVGIKTGGAILSSYISKKLNIKNYKIKISVDAHKCNKTPIESLKSYNETYILNKKNKYIICEKIDDTIENNNVILFDESVITGGTINKAIDYLLNEKFVNKKNLFISTINSDKEFLNYNLKLNKIKNTDCSDIVWPWGYDN
jgi:hypoxanthine phosphoribosyltransferase